MRINDSAQAMDEATRRFGSRAVVGNGRPVSDWRYNCFYVGWKEHGTWQWLGIGQTWDEAFESVKKVKTHYSDRLEFYIA